MKIRLRQGYILVEFPYFVRAWGKFSTGTLNAKGMAMFPFILVNNMQEIPQWLITHELIHFRQQFETLFVGLPALSFIERLYAQCKLGMDKESRYVYAASEQEAYLHMHNPDYLRSRPFGAIWRYVFRKRAFVLVGPGQLKFLDDNARI